MKNTMIFAVIAVSLFSCTNEAVSEKKPEPAVQEVKKEESTKFTIKSQQDTTTIDGESIDRYKNGVIRMRGMMKNGKRDGLWKSWYEDGKPWSETTFKDGIKNGKTTTWFENGNKRYEGEYTNDNESGKWTYYDESGKKVTEKDYDKK